MLKSVKILDKEFVVQSYLQNEYAYLVSQEKDFASIRVEFWQKDEKQIFSSNMKMNKEWKDFVKQIDIPKLKLRLDELFGFCPF